MSVILLESICPQCGIKRTAGWTRKKNPSLKDVQNQAYLVGWRQVNGVFICGDCVVTVANTDDDADPDEAPLPDDEICPPFVR